MKANRFSVASRFAKPCWPCPEVVLEVVAVARQGVERLISDFPSGAARPGDRGHGVGRDLQAGEERVVVGALAVAADLEVDPGALRRRRRRRAAARCFSTGSDGDSTCWRWLRVRTQPVEQMRRLGSCLYTVLWLLGLQMKRKSAPRSATRAQRGWQQYRSSPSRTGR